jgi:Predicted signal-transduction protein containing cAMP-binding and CBS domains
MAVGELCRTEVITAAPGVSAAELARLMTDANVGSVIITTDDDRPVGIVTDRDLVVRVLAEHRDPKSTIVEDIMTTELVLLEEGTGLYDAVRCARDEGVRRLPVVDSDGRLTGIITVDDIVRLLVREMSCVTDIMLESSPEL